MANAQDWQLRSRAHACTKSEESFEDGETVYSRLRHTEDGYLREDFRAAAWKEVQNEPSVSIWNSIYRPPPPPKEEAVKKESAESLLRKLIEEEDEKNQNTIFILAVMLERKRLLIERDVQQQSDGELIRVYEYREPNETFLVQDPGLKLAELEAVQEEVVLMLGGIPPGQKKEKPEEADEDAPAEEPTTQNA
jgi:hypothetical protein